MNNPHVRELISALVDGELDDAGKEDVVRHLAHCALCREYEQTLRVLSTDLRALEPFGARDGFAYDIVRRVRRSEEESRLWSPVEAVARRFVAGLAAAVLIFVSLAMIVQKEEPVVVEPYLAGEQIDSSATRVLLAKETLSKDDVLLAAVTRK